MSVYNKSGTVLDSLFQRNGMSIETAHDISGNIVFESGERTRLKIMTYNVGQWYIGSGVSVPADKKTEYFNLQNGIMSRNRPDILFMQEYLSTWCQDGSLTSALLSPYFTQQETTNPTLAYKGHSICSNGIQMSDYTVHNFTTNKGNYPTFESAEITVSGKTITIVNTHNDYEEPYKTQDITDLLAFLATLDSFILCGDFNMGIYANTPTTSDNYRLGVDVFKDAGYNVGNCNPTYIPTYSGATSITDGGAADQMIASADIQFNNIYTDTAKLTDGINEKIDHLPLIAEVSFLTEEAST